MRNKKNVYKRKIKLGGIFRNIGSAVFTLFLAAAFCFLGYSVARPFAAVGEIQPTDEDESSTPLKDSLESLQQNDGDTITAYWIRDKSFESIEEIENEIKSVPEQYNTVVVPMKCSGGKLNYNSMNEGAELAGANADIDIGEVVELISSYGLIPAASVNIMEDNLYPKANNQAGFLNDKTHKIWLDASEKKGGKPWLNPASSAAREYSASITGEISQAGFKYIIGTNAEYPEFSQDALDTIGDRVQDQNRYLDLIDIVNEMANKSESKGTEMWLEISAYDLFMGSCEVYESMLLDTSNTVVQINLSEFNSKMDIGGESVDFSKMTIGEKIKKICEITETYIYKTSFIPEITDNKLSSTQIITVEETFEEMGYTSYIVK